MPEYFEIYGELLLQDCPEVWDILEQLVAAELDVGYHAEGDRCVIAGGNEMDGASSDELVDLIQSLGPYANAAAVFTSLHGDCANVGYFAVGPTEEAKEAALSAYHVADIKCRLWEVTDADLHKVLDRVFEEQARRAAQAKKEEQQASVNALQHQRQLDPSPLPRGLGPDREAR